MQQTNGLREYPYGAMPTDTAFQDACVLADTKPTRRQFRKWSNRAGAAWAAAHPKPVAV